MTVSPSSLRYYLSGGRDNADPNASLGGERSSVLAPVGLFDPVTGDESATGDVEHRCVYFCNEDPDPDGLIDPVLWVRSNTPSLDTTMDVGLDPAGKNSEAAAVADDGEAPGGVSFSSPPHKAAGVALPGSPYGEGDYVAVWVRRTVAPHASSALTDPSVLRVEGDTV